MHLARLEDLGWAPVPLHVRTLEAHAIYGEALVQIELVNEAGGWLRTPLETESAPTEPGVGESPVRRLRGPSETSGRLAQSGRTAVITVAQETPVLPRSGLSRCHSPTICAGPGRRLRRP